MPAPYCYDHPRPMVTVDLIVFSLVEQSLQVLLVRRGREPFAGKWAIPGGFLEMDEPAEAGARRELREETGLEIAGPVEPIGFFARPDRDPRGRTITLAYAAVVRPGEHERARRGRRRCGSLVQDWRLRRAGIRPRGNPGPSSVLAQARCDRADAANCSGAFAQVIRSRGCLRALSSAGAAPPAGSILAQQGCAVRTD